jgi:hypothetical protein
MREVEKTDRARVQRKTFRKETRSVVTGSKDKVRKRIV